jgi:hypothetical protein
LSRAAFAKPQPLQIFFFLVAEPTLRHPRPPARQDCALSAA